MAAEAVAAEADEEHAATGSANAYANDGLMSPPSPDETVLMEVEPPAPLLLPADEPPASVQMPVEPAAVVEPASAFAMAAAAVVAAHVPNLGDFDVEALLTQLDISISLADEAMWRL